MSEQENILCLNNLVCGYENFNLNNISLEIKAGAFGGIIGPNGSGKTTLLKAISGILKIKKGTILYGNKSLSEISKKELSKELAVVSQNPDFPDITVEDYVSLGRIPFYKRFQFVESFNDSNIITDSMRITNILQFRNKYINKLSGGEQQLCVIARALAQEPKILLLDEPTNFLDISRQVEILDLLKHLNKTKNITVIMVLHDLNLAGEYCNTLYLLKNGGVYTFGDPEEVLTYQNVEEVYETTVVVDRSPVSHKPFVYIVSKDHLVHNNKPKQE